MAGLILKAPYYSPKSKPKNGGIRGGYVEYISKREGVELLPRSGMADYIGERKGSHGLFSDEGMPIVLSQIKAEVDEPRLAELYDLWYGCKCEICRTYTDAKPTKIPIEENKEFKSIRNAVVNLAVNYGSRMGHDELKEEKAVISTPRNGKPLKLIACLTSLFYHAGSIIEKSSAKEGHDTLEVDSKLRREIEMKKRGEISLHG